MKNGLLAVCSWFLGFTSLLFLAIYGEPKLKHLGIVGVIIFFVIFILIVIATAFAVTCFIGKQHQISQEKEDKEKEQRIKELEKKYSNYVSIVNRKSKRLSENLQQYYPNADISKEPIGHHYLIAFDKYISKFKKQDTFTIAACLMYCLTKNKMIVCCNSKEYNDDIGLGLATAANCELALVVALELISEPITFEKSSTGEFVEKKHPKKHIVIPNGIIKDYSLYENIAYSLYMNTNDYYNSIIHFSNLLQLIYLNCK